MILENIQNFISVYQNKNGLIITLELNLDANDNSYYTKLHNSCGELISDIYIVNNINEAFNFFNLNKPEFNEVNIKSFELLQVIN